MRDSAGVTFHEKLGLNIVRTILENDVSMMKVLIELRIQIPPARVMTFR
jgi:hypothetical protein